MTSIKLPLISIIVPAHNAEHTISRCIESIINQNLKELELILIDDNSTDATYSIMKSFYELYPTKIIVLQSKKSEHLYGPGYARNLGIVNAHGVYIGFVDSDDWVDSSLFHTVYEALIEANADIAIFGVKDEYSNSICSKVRYKYNYNVINHTYALNLLCRLNNNDYYISPMVCQKVYKTDYIKKHHLYFDVNSLYEDDQFTFCSFLQTCKIVLVPDVYYHYYQNYGSITHTFSKMHIDTMIDAFLKMRSYLCDNCNYNIYIDFYYSYMDKCISSMLNTLFNSEPTVKIQKKYIIYLFEKLSRHFPLEEWISYLDNERIKRFFNITK